MKNNVCMVSYDIVERLYDGTILHCCGQSKMSDLSKEGTAAGKAARSESGREVAGTGKKKTRHRKGQQACNHRLPQYHHES